MENEKRRGLGLGYESLVRDPPTHVPQPRSRIDSTHKKSNDKSVDCSVDVVGDTAETRAVAKG